MIATLAVVLATLVSVDGHTSAHLRADHPAIDQASRGDRAGHANPGGLTTQPPSIANAAPAQAADPHEGFVVAPYLQMATTTGVTILWETQRPTAGVVEYGVPRPRDERPRLDQRAELPGRRTLHEVRLPDLKPATDYFYRVVVTDASGGRLEGPVRTFRTAPEPGGAVGFALFGDSQDNPAVWGRVSTHAWNERPDFAIHAGDLVGTGGDKGDWTEDFFPPAWDLMSRVAVYSVLGNHEDDAQLYYDYMDNRPPGTPADAPEHYYAFSYGDVRFYMLDSNRPCSAGSEQHQWLAWALASSTARWNIVVHHHPPYTADENDYGDTTRMAAGQGDPGVADLRELYDRFGVDLVVFGHIHDYERSWPIRAGRVHPGAGVTYLQLGGAGGSLENYAPWRRWHTAKVRRTHHFAMAEAVGERMTIRAYDDDWRLFDQFTLTARGGPTNVERFAGLVPPPAPAIAPDPRSVIGPATVSMRAASGWQDLYYTTDGAPPTRSATRYQGPFEVAGGTTVRAAVIPQAGPASPVTAVHFRSAAPIPAEAPADRGDGLSAGLRYAYYEGQYDVLADMLAGEPIRRGVAPAPDITALDAREDAWGVRFTGLLRVPESGVWRFATRSDDGSRLRVAGVEVVENDGSHAPRTRRGVVALQAGWHRLTLDFFEDHVGQELTVYWAQGDAPLTPIPANAYAHR